MKAELFQQLLEKYITSSISDSDRKVFLQLLRKPAYRQLLSKNMDEQFSAGELPTEEDISLRESIFKQIQNEVNNPVVPVRKLFTWKRFAVAASLIIVLGLGYYLVLFKKQNSGSEPVTFSTNHDAAPGRFKAKLTLVDGSTIVLDSAAMGQLAKQGGTSIIHQDGQLMYNADNQGGEILNNTVSTANGETFSLQLADGSQVFMNSASSVKFPVAFPGTERKIEITGEVYISVAKNPNQPFIVSVNGTDVQALGTEFNINAYTDEVLIKTTLIEGAVQVSTPGSTQPLVIRPGQQARSKGNDISVVNNVNIEEAIAWKNGNFHFESADLKSLLRQFSRWYNVEVVFEGDVPNDKYFVIVSRKSSLSAVLKILQANDINFHIEGKKLFVSPK